MENQEWKGENQEWKNGSGKLKWKTKWKDIVQIFRNER